MLSILKASPIAALLSYAGRPNRGATAGGYEDPVNAWRDNEKIGFCRRPYTLK